MVNKTGDIFEVDNKEYIITKVEDDVKEDGTKITLLDSEILN